MSSKISIAQEINVRFSFMKSKIAKQSKIFTIHAPTTTLFLLFLLAILNKFFRFPTSFSEQELHGVNIRMNGRYI